MGYTAERTWVLKSNGGFESQLFHLLALWFWASYSLFVSLFIKRSPYTFIAELPFGFWVNFDKVLNAS